MRTDLGFLKLQLTVYIRGSSNYVAISTP